MFLYNSNNWFVYCTIVNRSRVSYQKGSTTTKMLHRLALMIKQRIDRLR